MEKSAKDQVIQLIPELSHRDKEMVERALAFRARCTALAIIRRPDGKVLVDKGTDPTRDLTFYRAPGGGIDFGEHSHHAVVREVMEEMRLEIKAVDTWKIVENIFTYKNKLMHEILFLTHCEFVDPSLYDQEEFLIEEPGRESTYATWKTLAEIEAEGAVLFPEPMKELF